MVDVMAPATRMTADERRADVLRVAVAEFAKRGYQGTSTEDVARAAGISQPYLFKMFPTKKSLFLALVQHGFERVRQAFIDAVGDATGDAALDRMGERYGELLRDRDELLLQMQAYAACDDPEIRERVRAAYARLVIHVERLSDAGQERIDDFLRNGMWLNVAAAMGVEDLSAGCEWIRAEQADPGD
jgi:AcrR family transcriptional regulator